MMLSAFMTGSAAVYAETLKSGDFEYTVLSDGTLEISNYTGTATEVTVPEKIDGKNVTSIGSSAFSENKSLESVELPESVTKIKVAAFRDCENLANIKVGKNINELHVLSFDGTAYKNNGDNWENGALYLGSYLIAVNSSAPADFEVKEGTTVIAGELFRGVENNIEHFTIPKSVTVIPDYIGVGKIKLKSITVSEENENYSSLDGVLFNKDKTVLYFYPRAKEDKEYTIPKGVKTISELSFYNTYNLEKVTFSSSVRTIEKRAFDTSGLKEVELNDGLKTIKGSAFCLTHLAKVFIPKSVKKMAGKRVFGDSNHYIRVYGYRNSAAQKCAKRSNYKFTAVDPAAPKKTTVKGAKGKIKVNYKKVKKAEGFQVKATKGKKSVVKTYKTKKSVTKAVKGLKKGSYKVKIRAFRTFRGSRVYGKWTKAKTVKVK